MFKKSGISINQSFQLQKRFQEAANNIYSQACLKYWTDDKVKEEQEKRIFNTKEWQVVPQWVRSYIKGYLDCQAQLLKKYELEYRVFLKNEWVPIRSVAEKDLDKLEQDAYGYVWKLNPDKFYIKNKMFQ